MCTPTGPKWREKIHDCKHDARREFMRLTFIPFAQKWSPLKQETPSTMVIFRVQYTHELDAPPRELEETEEASRGEDGRLRMAT
mmetsp:Transcript_1006/g.3460  ORF Transcript_1006/g.3460 Transcript_1006/m.3460 type:complete len:84 (-) Transcript_1006:770-1021(-)